jgi:hypothetical protein
MMTPSHLTNTSEKVSNPGKTELLEDVPGEYVFHFWAWQESYEQCQHQLIQPALPEFNQVVLTQLKVMGFLLI